MKTTCFFSGHRFMPFQDIPAITALVKEYIHELVYKRGVTTFISGGAVGFDTLCADIVLKMQEDDAEFAQKVRLVLYLPCYDQSKKWSESDKYHLNMLKCKASEYKFITPSNYTPDCMRIRNYAMVDSSAYGIIYCTKGHSGTAQTFRYALSKKRGVVNVASVISDTR